MVPIKRLLKKYKPLKSLNQRRRSSSKNNPRLLKVKIRKLKPKRTSRNILITTTILFVQMIQEKIRGKSRQPVPRKKDI